MALTAWVWPVSGIPRRRLGRSGLELTELSLGAAFIGGREDPLLDDPLQATRRMDGVAVATVQRALELGITHIDTSPLYEPSERRIGMALAEVDAPELTISTKVGTHAARRYSYAADDIRWSLEQSLKLLGRDRVDIVLIHDPPTMAPVSQSNQTNSVSAAIRSLPGRVVRTIDPGRPGTSRVSSKPVAGS